MLRPFLVLLVLIVWFIEEARLLLIYHLPSLDFFAGLIVYLAMLWLMRTQKRY